MTLSTGANRRRKEAQSPSRRSKTPALPLAVTRQIARFRLDVRPRIRAIVRTSPRAAELLEVFPGLLYALAIGHRSEQDRAEAARSIDAGAPLKLVAQTLGVPMWMRRLPPEAYCGDLADLPNEESFGRRVPARMPARASDAADWLDAVRFAARAAGADFALWIARHRIHGGGAAQSERHVLLAAYAWHSVNPGHPASDLVWSRWRMEMAPDTAICAAKSWFNRMKLSVSLAAPLDPWLQAGECDGFSFVPLTTARAVLEEARVMSNCADQYAAALVENRCRLFSIQRDGRHEATLEIVPHNREIGVLTIGQLKACQNAPATYEHWRAAFRWLAAQPRLLQTQPLADRRPAMDPARWTAMLAPYRAARGGAPWLPETPQEEAIGRLEAGLSLLARDADIRSWLFL